MPPVSVQVEPSLDVETPADKAWRRWRGRCARALRRPVTWFLVLGLALTMAYVRQSWPPVFTASPYAHGDGSYYFAYLRSLAFDRDVNFGNDYAMLGNQFGYGVNATTGRAENVFTIGPAVMWMPFAAVGQAVVRAGNAWGGAWEAPDGTGPRFQRIVFFGSVVFGVLALALAFSLAAPLWGPRLAFVAVVGMATGTPLLWFMLRQPSYSHAAAALAVAAFVALWYRTQQARGPASWAALGALLGIAMLVRPQEVTHAILPLADWLALAIAAARRRDGKALARLIGVGLLFVAAAVVAFVPQMLAWRSIYGHALTIPQGGGFMLWGSSRFGAVLFSSRAGLFAWHPLTLLACLGLVGLSLSRRTPVPARRLARLGLLAIAAQAYVNGAASDWWGGWAFGGRRFLDCTVYLAFGLTAALAKLPRIWEWVTRRCKPALPVLAVAAFAFFNWQLMDDYLMSRAAHAAPQPMKPIWQRAMITAMDALYAAVGNVGSAPANWWFALRAGASPERYDVAAGHDLFATGGTAQARLTDDRHAMGGFGEPSNFQGRPCRWVEGTRATWVFALRKPGNFSGRVEVAAAAAGTRVTMRVGGRIVANHVLASSAWTELPVEIPRVAVTAGINYVEIEQSAPAPGPWPIGTTGVHLPWEFSADSAGYHAGNRASVTVVGDDPLEAPDRGVTAFRLDGRRPGAARLGSYDTFGDDGAAAALKRTIDGLQPGTIVAVVARDDASRRWNAQGDEALRALGGKETLMGRYRASYALIGVKGAAPGQAMETWSPAGPAHIDVGRVAAERKRGTAWGAVTLTEAPPTVAP